MQIIPFGNVIESRMELSKKYNLVACRGQVWLLTGKCRDNYDPITYIEYLQGKREKPVKRKQPTSVEKELQELENM